MSLSAADNNGNFTRGSTGKTPPPAPSAAFAKRARERELQAEERMGGRYIPPALRAIASGGSSAGDVSPSSTVNVDISPLPPTNYPSGFRRARAGTLPSNVQLAAQRFAAASSNLSSLPGSTESFVEPYSPSPAQTPTNSTINPTRPGLRHSASIASSAASSAVTERNSRFRSGSLTSPPSSLANAFSGSAIFSTSWLSGGTGGGSSFATVDELRPTNSLDTGGVDDFDIHTLDYLGLDDNFRAPAATISELRSQAQAALAGNLANPPRHRALTVSNPYRAKPSAAVGSLLPTQTAEEDDYLSPYGRTDEFGRSALDPYDPTDSLYPSSVIAKGFKQAAHLGVSGTGARPRAISVGILDDPSRLSQRLISSNDAQKSIYADELANLSLNTHNLTSPTVRFTSNEVPGAKMQPYLGAPNMPNHMLSPKNENSPAQIQTPSRSLWIGNLDSSVTSEQLIHVFAPYGAIESLRLLPEKECGFVNFVDQVDAIRAKEDVLNRLGGRIGLPNGEAVRIGFGKADSAPAAPAKSGAATTSVTSPTNSGKGASGGQQGGLNGIESQLQSTPTRALWIGSIPSTTTPATILSVFSPFGPIESARVLTHKNCGFINFERLDDAVRARKALNGRDVLGSDVGAIRIGFAKVPVKNGTDQEDGVGVGMTGIGDMSVGATIQALRNVKGASTIPADQQVLGGSVENYRSNLLLSMIGSGVHNLALMGDGSAKQPGWTPSVTEQQMIIRELSEGSPDAEAEIQALAEFRPPTMYYTSIPLVSERSNNRRWDASKLRDLRKRLDSGAMSTPEIDEVVADFCDGEIVDLASDWLGNTVVQKLFEKCSLKPRVVMLERIVPHLAMIGIHKNGTWAAQKIIECVQSPEEVALIAQNLRPYIPPLLLDQFGNYVVQCCLRFQPTANEFIFDAMVDRLWEIAQGRFGARSMRACLENAAVTVAQQRRVATAVILNSIPLATNPNGALLLTWLLDTSGFPARYQLLAPRFTPHLSHLCTHKLASLTVLRIVNQKIEPSASTQIVHALFFSAGDHVLSDVLGDQVNGVAVVHKILTSPYIDANERPSYLEATKRVLIELKVSSTQAYRRLIEEVGLPLPNIPAPFPNSNTPTGQRTPPQSPYGMPTAPTGYPSSDQNLASMMATLQMSGQSHVTPQGQQPMPPLQIDPAYGQPPSRNRASHPVSAFSPNSDPFNPFSARSNDSRTPIRRGQGMSATPTMSPAPMPSMPYGAQSPSLGQASNVMGMAQSPSPYMTPQSVPPHLYQAYMYQMYQQQNPANIGAFH